MIPSPLSVHQLAIKDTTYDLVTVPCPTGKFFHILTNSCENSEAAPA